MLKRSLVCVKKCRQFRFYSEGKWSSYTDSMFSKRALQSITPVTLQQMYDIGKKPNDNTFINNCRFLHHEVPIRLSKMISDLDNLPYGLSKAPNILKIRKLHVEAIHRILTEQAPSTFEEAKTLTHILKYILHSHNFVVPHIACAMVEISEKSSFKASDLSNCPFLTQFLDRYLSRRISIRILMAQQCSLLAQYLNPTIRSPNFVGEIDSNCQVEKVIKNEVDKASEQCLQFYGTCPEVTIKSMRNLNQFKYVRGHLQLIVFELIKNSLRSVCEYRDKPEDHPVKIIICDGSRDLTIKICDEGGGISREELPLCFNWSYSTGLTDYKKLNKFLDQFQEQKAGGRGMTLNQLSAMQYNSLLGLGYGLPTARLYCRYFGGDVELYSMEGHGTDAFVFLNILGHKMPHQF